VLANCVKAAASAVFNWGLKRNLVTDNPCRGIEAYKTKAAVRFLSNDEIRAVWSLFDELGLYQSNILKLILLTAQRPGEVTSLRWEHVDQDAALWTMPGAPAPGWPGTKNGRDHEVPLTEPVLALLSDLEPKPVGHVFPSIHRGKCINRPSPQPVWQTAGIPGSGRMI
jgi:integrase